MLRRALALNANYATAHHWLSLVLRSGNHVAEENNHAERAVALDPLSQILNVNLGDTLQKVGRFDEAAAQYQRAVVLSPKLPRGYDSLGILDAWARNRLADAVGHLQRSVALDPDNLATRASLVVVYLDIEDKRAAEPLVSSLLSRWPDDCYANAAAALFYAIAGDTVRARQYANKGHEAISEDALMIGVLRNADIKAGSLKAASERYAAAFPELLIAQSPRVDSINLPTAVGLAYLLRETCENDQAEALVEAAEELIAYLPCLGNYGYGVTDEAILAMRGDKAKALAALQAATQSRWRGPL